MTREFGMAAHALHALYVRQGRNWSAGSACKECECHLRMPHSHVFEAVQSRVCFQPTFSTYFQSDSSREFGMAAHAPCTLPAPGL